MFKWCEQLKSVMWFLGFNCDEELLIN